MRELFRNPKVAFSRRAFLARRQDRDTAYQLRAARERDFVFPRQQIIFDHSLAEKPIVKDDLVETIVKHRRYQGFTIADMVSITPQELIQMVA